MKEEKEEIRFTGQPSGHNFLGTSIVPQKQIDEDVLKIKDFAKEHKLAVRDKKNQPIMLIVPEDRIIFPHNKAALLLEVAYVFYYTNWNLPISVKKSWYGISSKNKFVGNKQDEEKNRQDLLSEIENFDKKKDLTNLVQIEIGHFKKIEHALEAVKLRIEE